MLNVLSSQIFRNFWALKSIDRVCVVLKRRDRRSEIGKCLIRQVISKGLSESLTFSKEYALIAFQPNDQLSNIFISLFVLHPYILSQE